VIRVLVADDDSDIRELVQLKLSSAGFEVATVPDGRAALDQALADPPDLLVLDLMMPRLTGLEVCAALRGSPATARLPIILLTAKAQEADITRGLATGADDYVVKPFSPRELLSRVQAVLSRQQR
jgi:DNA-binding response OmpR family regulator